MPLKRLIRLFRFTEQAIQTIEMVQTIEIVVLWFKRFWL
jgi:hypothetical protein